MEPADLLTRAGKLLYRELPEEYRYRDPRPVDGDLGDLEAYLHGFGSLLDLLRGTTEQAYADAFAEVADNGRSIQPWLIPYLAELVGAELRAPDPEDRMRELNETVSWYKSKGCAQSVRDRRRLFRARDGGGRGLAQYAACPRMTLPPFTRRSRCKGRRRANVGSEASAGQRPTPR